MPAWVRRLSIFLRSLRFMTLALLAGSAFMASAAGISLIHGIREANYFMERAGASQAQLELLMLLSGRITDYTIAVNDFSRAPHQDRTALASATSEVNAVFERLNRSVADQVALLEGREARNREATEGLAVARMRAMFQNLNRQVYNVLESKQDIENKTENIHRILDVYAIGFAPMLSQAIEEERSEARSTGREMEDLKRSLTATATAILAGAVGLAALLYIGPVISILRRVSQTVRQGAVGRPLRHAAAAPGARRTDAADGEFQPYGAQPVPARPPVSGGAGCITRDGGCTHVRTARRQPQAGGD
jgi:hypothetical protein